MPVMVGVRGIDYMYQEQVYEGSQDQGLPELR